jgi:hypothetical protein
MPRIHASKLGIACGATRRLSVAMSSGSCTVLANAPQDEEIGQNVDHIDRLELAGDTAYGDLQPLALPDTLAPLVV